MDLSEYGKDRLFSLLIKATRNLVKLKSSRFESFMLESLNSNSKTRLLILVEGFRKNPSLYVNQIHNFIFRYINNKWFERHESFAWRVRQLLKETYPYFSELQKGVTVQLLASIESEREKQRAIQCEKEEWIGYERFTWLMCVPQNDIAQIQNVKTDFEQLSLQFPDFEDNEPNRVRMRGIGAPLTAEEYDLMSHEQWKVSFLKYNTNEERDFESGKGGITQHARQFEVEVKNRPDFFYTLIKELINDDSYEKDYLTHGMSGLVESKYDVYQVYALFKNIDVTNWDDFSDVYSIVRLCSYFINNKVDDDYLFHFLIKMAKTYRDPIDDSLTIRVNDKVNESVFSSGFNSVRGHAVHLLTYCYYFERHRNLLFDTLDHIVENDLLKVRSHIIPNVAVLMNLDKERTLILFLKLTENSESLVLEHASSSAQYLSRYDFNRLKPYFLSTFEHTNLHKNTAIILTLSWLFDREDAIELLDLFLQKSHEAKEGAIDVAAHNIIDENNNPIARSIELFSSFFEETDERVIHAYRSAFRKFKTKHFSILFVTLSNFKKSAVIRKDPRPFFEYIVKCATKFPEECLELVEDFAIYEKPNIQSSGYYEKEPLKVVINAYSALWGRKQRNSALLNKALLLYDKMLLDDRFHREATMILEEVEQ
jgi:hypothetical protein